MNEVAKCDAPERSMLEKAENLAGSLLNMQADVRDQLIMLVSKLYGPRGTKLANELCGLKVPTDLGEKPVQEVKKEDPGLVGNTQCLLQESIDLNRNIAQLINLVRDGQQHGK